MFPHMILTSFIVTANCFTKYCKVVNLSKIYEILNRFFFILILIHIQLDNNPHCATHNCTLMKLYENFETLSLLDKTYFISQFFLYDSRVDIYLRNDLQEIFQNEECLQLLNRLFDVQVFCRILPLKSLMSKCMMNSHLKSIALRLDQI